MRGRIEKLMMGSSSGTCGTALSRYLCRDNCVLLYYLNAKLLKTSQIIDSDDQVRLLRRLIKAEAAR